MHVSIPPHPRKIPHQYLLNIMIPPRIGVLDAYQFKPMLAADFGFLSVTRHHNAVFCVLPAVQLDGENGDFILVVVALVYYKVEAACVE